MYLSSSLSRHMACSYSLPSTCRQAISCYDRVATYSLCFQASAVHFSPPPSLSSWRKGGYRTRSVPSLSNCLALSWNSVHYTPLFVQCRFSLERYHYSLRWFTDLFSPKIRMFARIVAFHMHIIIVIMSSRSVQNAIAFNVRALLWAFKHSFCVSHCLYSGLEFNLFWSLINLHL